jgi:hypothetical protein
VVVEGEDRRSRYPLELPDQRPTHVRGERRVIAEVNVMVERARAGERANCQGRGGNQPRRGGGRYPELPGDRA